MGHPYTGFVLSQDEKCAKSASAKGQMATVALDTLQNLAAKAYHHLSMAPGQHNEDYFGW